MSEMKKVASVHLPAAKQLSVENCRAAAEGIPKRDMMVMAEHKAVAVA